MGEITFDEFMKIGKKLEEENKDDTPFSVVSQDKIAVVGNAEKTEKKVNDYKLVFKIPKAEADKVSSFLPQEKIKKIEEIDDLPEYVYITVLYEKISIAPKDNNRLVQLLAGIIPFYHKITDDRIEFLSENELGNLFLAYSADYSDAIIKLVRSFLPIPIPLQPYILPIIAARVVVELISAHPELLRETEHFLS
ncbi:hypothetical protein FACS189418_6920 [Clostridia bacterium]|nr:hypothetical protein FACS189418_6920 [Clostridia bacterium]